MVLGGRPPGRVGHRQGAFVFTANRRIYPPVLLFWQITTFTHMTEPIAIFIHIPKTAGTTLHGLIWRHYPSDTVYTVDWVAHTLNDLAALDADQKSRIRIVTGHIDFGVHALLPGPHTYFTIVREPTDLVISYYYYICRASDHPHHHLATQPGMNLEKFMASKIDASLYNMQTRMLAGKHFALPPGECSPELLEIAKQNLHDHFSVVGLAEEFDTTVLLLRRAFHWRNLFYARMNVTSRRPAREDLSPHVRDAIVEANRFDSELYDYTQMLFQERIRQYGPEFDGDLRRFQLYNRLLYPLMYAYWEGRRRFIMTVRRWFPNFRR